MRILGIDPSCELMKRAEEYRQRFVEEEEEEMKEDGDEGEHGQLGDHREDEGMHAESDEEDVVVGVRLI